MSASGGRRIKRSISIDVTSIRFLDEDEMQRLNKAHLLKPYLTSRHQEINEWNRQQGSTESVLNLRRMTNIGTFRAYLNEYLRNHPRIRKDMTLMVRQLALVITVYRSRSMRLPTPWCGWNMKAFRLIYSTTSLRLSKSLVCDFISRQLAMIFALWRVHLSSN